MASAASLPPEQAASYTVIIDGILATADLNTISAKQIREGLQKKVPYDIAPQKKAIKQLIMQRFDKFHEELESKQSPPIETVERVVEQSPQTNGHTKLNAKSNVKLNVKLEDVKLEDKSSLEPDASPAKRRAESIDTPSQSSPPPPKKKKIKNEDLDADAALAAKLQAEENLRSRPTRGGAARKAAPMVKKKPKKKSKDKVSAEDDSDVEGSRPAKKVNPNTGFHATKRIWAYIKENDLQDPADKRTIRCDEPMKAVFKTEKINMFSMTKLMNQNMYTEGE